MRNEKKLPWTVEALPPSTIFGSLGLLQSNLSDDAAMRKRLLREFLTMMENVARTPTESFVIPRSGAVELVSTPVAARAVSAMAAIIEIIENHVALNEIRHFAPELLERYVDAHAHALSHLKTQRAIVVAALRKAEHQGESIDEHLQRVLASDEPRIDLGAFPKKVDGDDD